MKLLGWLDVSKRDVKEEKDLIRQLEDVSAKSKSTHERIDKIINIEKVRLRNLELRAEVLTRSRSR